MNLQSTQAEGSDTFSHPPQNGTSVTWLADKLLRGDIQTWHPSKATVLPSQSYIQVPKRSSPGLVYETAATVRQTAKPSARQPQYTELLQATNDQASRPLALTVHATS